MDANNLRGRYPMQPADKYPQDHLLSSQLCYQVLNFDKVIDFATIDRGANNGLAGMSMVPILLINKYVTIKGMGGMSRHNLRLGDFKSVLAVHDPKSITEREIMCIFRNYRCHTNPEERMKTSSIHPALQLEEKGIIIEDRLRSQRRITLPQMARSWIYPPKRRNTMCGPRTTITISKLWSSRVPTGIQAYMTSHRGMSQMRATPKVPRGTLRTMYTLTQSSTGLTTLNHTCSNVTTLNR